MAAERPPPPVLRFVQKDGVERRCRICLARDGLHTEQCPIVAIHAELREITAASGIFVTELHEALERIERRLVDPG